MQVTSEISLKSYNSFNIDVSAKYFAEVGTIDEAREIITDKKFINEKRLLLGSGSNILFTKNFDGLIIKVSIPGINIVHEDEHYVRFKVAGGEVWHDFVLHVVNQNLGGIEN